MDITKLFENWQIEKTLPQPFQKEVDKKKVSNIPRIRNAVRSIIR